MSTPRGNPIQRLPLPLFFVVIAGLWIGIRLVLRTQPITPTYLVIEVVGGLLFATVLTVIVGTRRRRLGGADASVVFLRALRTGTVPADTDTTPWPAELDRVERATRRARWLLPLLAALPIAFGVWAAVMDSKAFVLGLALAFVFVVLVGIALVSGVRQLRRIDHLRTEIRSSIEA